MSRRHNTASDTHSLNLTISPYSTIPKATLPTCQLVYTEPALCHSILVHNRATRSSVQPYPLLSLEFHALASNRLLTMSRGLCLLLQLGFHDVLRLLFAQTGCFRIKYSGYEIDHRDIAEFCGDNAGTSCSVHITS